MCVSFSLTLFTIRKWVLFFTDVNLHEFLSKITKSSHLRIFKSRSSRSFEGHSIGNRGVLIQLPIRGAASSYINNQLRVNPHEVILAKNNHQDPLYFLRVTPSLLRCLVCVPLDQQFSNIFNEESKTITTSTISSDSPNPPSPLTATCPGRTSGFRCPAAT